MHRPRFVMQSTVQVMHASGVYGCMIQSDMLCASTCQHITLFVIKGWAWRLARYLLGPKFQSASSQRRYSVTKTKERLPRAITCGSFATSYPTLLTTYTARKNCRNMNLLMMLRYLNGSCQLLALTVPITLMLLWIQFMNLPPVQTGCM
ncbi:uncharacterized protein LOC124678492 [Lolium rigidum]|uniref:uncharacterized protein LOC124678492 n=1 Tax=Lolium rigidum TaxID=89674 RepID=UPI001F5DA3DC|nr:uncharacterized protein LOC124678492 [Lolium rigidum]